MGGDHTAATAFDLGVHSFEGFQVIMVGVGHFLLCSLQIEAAEQSNPGGSSGTRTEVLHVAQIIAVHHQQQLEVGKIRRPHLTSTVRGGKAMPAQDRQSAVVRLLTDMPRSGARRIDRPLWRQVPQDRLRHG